MRGLIASNLQPNDAQQLRQQQPQQEQGEKSGIWHKKNLWYTILLIYFNWLGSFFGDNQIEIKVFRGDAEIMFCSY